MKNPEAAMKTDHEGKYPLHSFLKKGWLWQTGIKELFQAAPQTLIVREKETNMLPFMIAACHASQQTNDNDDNLLNKQISPLELTTVFELLRKDPASILSTI